LGGRIAVCRPAQPLTAGTVKPAKPASTVLRGIIPSKFPKGASQNEVSMSRDQKAIIQM
jgi:hypothetical protein